MAGTLYGNDIKLSKALCSGRRAAAVGDLVSTNPHSAGSPESDAWIAGYDGWAAAPATPHDDQNGCAIAYGGGFVPGRATAAPPPGTPTDTWSKAEILAWVTDHIGKPEANLTKAELLDIVQGTP